MIEATIYRGSHNLIPFEFAIFFAYGLPAIIAEFVGKKVYQKLNND
jgi:Na+-driven multidrug efflux pump